MNAKLLIAGIIGGLTLGTAAAAHTVWLRSESGQPGVFRVFFGGHQGAIDPYDAAKLKTVTAVDAQGRDLRVSRAGGDNAVILTVEGEPAVILAHFDNGIHTRQPNGPSVERPMNEVPGATGASHAVKHHKTIAAWGSDQVTRAMGQPFELIPQDTAAPRAGQPMRIQVRMDGRPMPGIRIGRGEDNGEAVTDANGMASFTPGAGFNKIWAGKRIPVRDHARYNELSYEYSLGFEAP